MALCTATEYKAWRGLAGTDWDTLIGTLASTATREIESLCSRVTGGFEAATFTETFDGDGSQMLIVGSGPITSITSIKTGNATLTTLDSSTYTHDGDRTILMVDRDDGWGMRVDSWGDRLPSTSKSPSFPSGFQNVQVVYIAGYASGSIPDDLKLACYRFIDHYLASRGNDFEAIVQVEGNANATMRATDDFRQRMVSLVRKWRSIR